MEYNKSKWELKYEAFKNGEIDEDIKLLNEKKKEMADKFVAAYNAGKKEDANKVQDEMNKQQAELDKKEKSKSSITSNQAKIENILQLKKDLVKESAELLKKQGAFKAYTQAKKYVEMNDKNSEKLQLDIEAIDAQIKQLNIQINNKNTTPADRAKFEQDKAKLNAQRQKKSVEVGKLNNDEYLNSRRTIDKLESEVGTYDIKTIKSTLAKNEKLIAKCDLIGKNLVNGKSMEEINASLKKFKFTPNKDFAKKVSTMRNLYEKEEKANIEVAKKGTEKATEDVEKAYEKAKFAIEQAKKEEEEYKKISNLPAPKTPWYKKVPVLKQITNVVSKIFNKEQTHINVEEAKAKVEQARKEAEAAKKEYLDKKAEIEKAKAETEKKEKGRSTDYLEELRNQKGENTILEGMTLYGDTFKDRLKYQMPNIKTSLTQDEIDKAKSKNNYVLENYKYKNNQGKEIAYNDHEKDKRAYDPKARKDMIKKNIEEMKALRAKKEASQRDDGSR